MRTLKLESSIPWCEESYSSESTQLYCAKFLNPKKDFILAGGTDKNIAKVINADTHKIATNFGPLTKPCLVVDSAPDGSLVLVGCADGSI